MFASIRETAWKLPVAALLVACITWFCFQLTPFNSTTVAFAYLLLVLAVAARWGLVVSVATSLLAMACLNYYFLPPIGTFVIADPQNWIALVAFLVTSIVASHLADRASRRADEAVLRQQGMEKLYEFSRGLLLTPGGQAVGAQVTDQVAKVYDCKAVAFFDRSSGHVYRAGSSGLLISESKLKDSAMQGTEFQDGPSRLTMLPVSLGGHAIGSMAVLEGSVSETALHAIANLAAIAMEKERAQAAANRAEAAQHSEELKSTLLDAVAHEFKTPLTSIKAATTALLEDKRNDTQREMLTVIEEETNRLSDMVTEAIQMARIEAGKLRVDKRPMEVATVIESILDHSRPLLDDRKVEVSVQKDLPAVQGDRELIFIVLRQLLSNAVKYSPPGSPLEIRAESSGSQVVVTLADHGSGISDYDQVHIFDKFYRARNVQGQVPGTGMGLTIAREIVEVHGGQIWVHSKPGRGSEFSFSLPVAAMAVA